jgi:hypothetical protein
MRRNCRDAVDKRLEPVFDEDQFAVIGSAKWAARE